MNPHAENAQDAALKLSTEDRLEIVEALRALLLANDLPTIGEEWSENRSATIGGIPFRHG